jgi:hypothetical protein
VILTFANGNQIRGDLIKSATLRSDLSPVPLTLEAEIRAGDTGMDKLMAEGQLIGAGSDQLRIVKSRRIAGRAMQGDRNMEAYIVTALLDACLGVAYVRSRAIIKENAALSAIYRAAGATIKNVDADFPVPRFCCPVGDTPTFHIARVLQEEGGTVRWKSSKLQFIRLGDLFKQQTVLTLPDSASEDTESSFLESHSVPQFFSLDKSGTAVFGNQDKPRAIRYSPFTDAQRLRNMTRCLVHRKVSRITMRASIGAGDLIAYTSGAKFAVITAAHVFTSGTDSGGAQDAYTRLWLGGLEG